MMISQTRNEFCQGTSHGGSLSHGGTPSHHLLDFPISHVNHPVGLSRYPHDLENSRDAHTIMARNTRYQSPI